MNYQIYAISADGKLNHAGVHKLGRISHKTIVKLERKWMMWRKQYIENHPSDYPMKTDRMQTFEMIVFPIDSPKNQRRFVLA